MTTWAVQLAVASLFALACGVLTAAWLRGRLGAAAVLLLVVALSVWVLDFAALVMQYRNADGFATCASDCSAVHYVSAVAFLAPPLLVALAAAAMLVSIARRMRVRRAREREVVG